MKIRTRALIGLAVLLLATSLPAWAAEEGGEGGFPGELVFKWINFAILFGVLGYLGWKYLPGLFAARSQAIRQGLEEAARAYEDSQRRLTEIEQHLAQLDREIEKIQRTAETEQAAERERIRTAARAEAEKILAAARAEIEATTRAAKLELKAYTARTAVELAAGEIRHQITAERQASLFARYVKSFHGGESRP